MAETCWFEFCSVSSRSLSFAKLLEGGGKSEGKQYKDRAQLFYAKLGQVW